MSQLVPFLNFGLEDSQQFECDLLYNNNNSDITNKKKMFITLEGLNSGVPTRTTPTLTPTTLRNIEQTFIELQSKPHENEAGFVPPLVNFLGNNQYTSIIDDTYSNKSQNIWQSSLSQSSSDSNTRSTPPLTQKTSLINNTPTRRNMGGRKPAKDINVSPEEEERRKVRRERNKAAAARCRKRRVDHTNALIKETDELEDKKRELQNELMELKDAKEQLEYLLDSHKNSTSCHLPSRSISPPDVKPFAEQPAPTQHYFREEKVKTEVIEQLPSSIEEDIFSMPPAKRLMLSQGIPISKPSRPNSLNVGVAINKNNILELGVPITTPSQGIQFNFDSLMVGGTGLTPVSAPLVPSCSTQQRNIPVDINSPDACNSNKLVSL